MLKPPYARTTCGDLPLSHETIFPLPTCKYANYSCHGSRSQGSQTVWQLIIQRCRGTIKFIQPLLRLNKQLRMGMGRVNSDVCIYGGWLNFGAILRGGKSQRGVFTSSEMLLNNNAGINKKMCCCCEIQC